MNQRPKHFSRLLSATVSAMLTLPACMPVIDTDMRDLKDWQASARKHLPVDSLAHAFANAAEEISKKADKREPSINDRIIATRDPFASPIPKIAMMLSRTINTSNTTSSDPTPALLHLLGTVHDSGKIYALIEADKQVHCVALKAALPSYPITVFRIANHAVELDRLLPDGSHIRSTLRQGK
jgi:Tfp pilus assembly protein PilP